MLERLLLAGLLLLLTVAAIQAARWALRRADARAMQRLQADAAQAPPAAPRIVYFTTSTCVVCRMQQEPAIEALRERRPDVRVDVVDAVAERALSDEFRVRSVPTTAVYDAEGALVSINRGFAPAAMLLAQIENRPVEAEGGADTAGEPLPGRR